MLQIKSNNNNEIFQTLMNWLDASLMQSITHFRWMENVLNTHIHNLIILKYVALMNFKLQYLLFITRWCLWITSMMMAEIWDEIYACKSYIKWIHRRWYDDSYIMRMCSAFITRLPTYTYRERMKENEKQIQFSKTVTKTKINFKPIPQPTKPPIPFLSHFHANFLSTNVYSSHVRHHSWYFDTNE